jgi:hypothetical protein
MKYNYKSDTTPDNLELILNEFNKDSATLSIICLLADEIDFDFNSLSTIFQNLDKPIIGGVFPGLIVDSQKKDSGIAVIGLPYDMNYQLIQLKEADDIEAQIRAFATKRPNNSNTLFSLFDTFSSHKSEFIHSLYSIFGNSISYLGGGCGSLEMIQKPVVITNTGTHQNSAVLSFIPKELSIGCSHGWSSISEPLKITESIGNKVISINWEPAYEVYKNLIYKHSKQQIYADNFFEIAKSYPLGMAKLESEFVVRDPIATDENTLTIIDEIPSGEFVYLLYGNEEKLLNGAREASRKANIQANQPVFCIDCISRVLFLEHRFEQELQAVSENPVIGYLAIGEIANSGDSYLEIFNKTIVVTQL